MYITPATRTIARARTLANINERAKRITDDYRLIWNRHEGCYMVAHKSDRARRYKISARGCSCPSRANYGTCKHWQGLKELATIEINRFRWLGWSEDLRRLEAFITEIRALRGHQH
jgi:hypothetical protein